MYAGKGPKFEEKEHTNGQMVSLQSHGLLKVIQNEYLYWDKVKYKQSHLSAEELWNAVKMDRYLRTKTVVFGEYAFKYYVTEYIQKALHHFDLNTSGILGSNICIAHTDKTRFIMSSIMEEAIASSQMEGAATTRKAAKEMIQRELKPKNKSEQMILNNYAAMQHIIQHKQTS